MELQPNPLVKAEPFKHQKEGLVQLLSLPSAVLADSTGLGKSFTALLSAAYWKEQFRKAKIVVVASNSSGPGWEDELQYKLHGLNVKSLISQSPKKRHEVYAFQHDKIDVLIVNYPLVVADKDYLITWAKLYPDSFIILDEVHYVKTPDSTATQSVLEVTKWFAYRLGLTATLVKNGYEEIFSQFNAVLPGFFKSLRQFEDQFCVFEQMKMKSRPYPIKVLVGYKNIGSLRDLVLPYVVKRTPKDAGVPYPEIEFGSRMVQLSEYQMDLYRKVRSGKLKLEGKKHTPLTKLIFSQQMANDPALLGLESPSKKFEYLKEYVDPTRKLVVYSDYKSMINRFTEDTMFKDALRITGDESQDQRRDNIHRFRNGDDPLIFINSAGAQSVNLQSSDLMLFYDFPWSFGDFLQAFGRIARIGSPFEKVHVEGLMAVGTVDEYKGRVLMEKGANISRFWDDFGMNPDLFAPIKEEECRL